MFVTILLAPAPGPLIVPAWIKISVVFQQLECERHYAHLSEIWQRTDIACKLAWLAVKCEIGRNQTAPEVNVTNLHSTTSSTVRRLSVETMSRKLPKKEKIAGCVCFFVCETPKPYWTGTGEDKLPGMLFFPPGGLWNCCPQVAICSRMERHAKAKACEKHDWIMPESEDDMVLDPISSDTVIADR